MIEQKHAINKIKTSTMYTCPMHLEIIKDAPGNCPLCGMNLVDVNKQKDVVVAINASMLKVKK